MTLSAIIHGVIKMVTGETPLFNNCKEYEKWVWQKDAGVVAWTKVSKVPFKPRTGR